MMHFLEKFISGSKEGLDKNLLDDQISRQVTALFTLISNIYGSDRLVMKAGKLDALNYMRSELLPEKVVALQRIVFEDPTIDKLPTLEEIPEILDEIEEEIADIIARKSVEDKLERKIAEKMQERHEEYVKEIKMQVIKENKGPENQQTLKKLDHIERLETKSLARSAMEYLRPRQLDAIVGQKRAIRSLLAKIAAPFPQHVILYGPPGVGKTTAARLVLEEVKNMSGSPFQEEAPFVEVDGTTMRWDPREVTNPLIGSVHDPIYQGAKRDFADSAIPEPKLGLVTEAHGGVLFIDEIGEMDPILQNKLLKVLEDKRVEFESSYYDPGDPNIPKWIRKVFEEGVPADFVLIGATTREPSSINPAIRSRCAEVFFEPLTPSDIQEIVVNAAENLGVILGPGTAEAISQYTIEGRKAINILADAYGLVLYRSTVEGEGEAIEITADDVFEIAQISRLHHYNKRLSFTEPIIGRVLGLGVSGFIGSIIEIEAEAFPARKEGQGMIRFNETAGSMAKDSVFNAAALIRRLTGSDINNYDLHVNVIGGGQIDGPSAGAAIVLAILSAIQGKPLRQDIALTGEISLRGKIKPVGGILEKIYGAKQGGVKLVFVPKENEQDVPRDLEGIEVKIVNDIQEIIEVAFVR